MRVLKYILIGIAVLFGILAIATFAMSESYHFEKSIHINATPEEIYPHISSTQAFNQWNPWLKLDPNMQVEYAGQQGQIGDKYCWNSEQDDAGEGCQEIVELVPNQRQKTRMQFKRPFESESFSEVILTPETNGTTVTWTLDSELERPKNLMSAFMSGAMDKSYGDGLNKLKEIVEKN